MPEPGGERLLDREAELEVAAAALDRAREGEGGLLVFLGPAGIGKTRLLETLRRSAEEGGTRVLKARASQLETSFPFGVARQLFEPVVAEASEAEAKELLSGAAGLSRPLLGLPGGEPGEEGSDFAALHGLHWLTANLAERGPLVLLVDDSHWADPDSLRFLAYLAARIEGLPVLLATTVRPAEPEIDRDLLDALLATPGAEVIEPGPLSEAAVAELAGRLLEGDVAPEFARACRDASGGNPFFCEELLASARSAGVDPDAGAAASVAQIGPETVGRAVLARLARLPEPCTQLARALAVLGGRAELRQAAPLAGLDEGEAAACADALAGVQLLRGERPLDFAHPIVRTSIYRSMGPLERAGMHAQAARALTESGAEAEEVAVHLVEIEPSGDPKVAGLLREAASAAADRGALQIAAAQLERALAEPPPPETVPGARLELGLVRLRTGAPTAPAELTRAVERTEPGTERLELALRAGRALGRASQAEAVRVCRLGLDGAPDDASEDRLRVVAELIMNASLFAEHAPLAWELLDRHEPEAEPGSGPEALLQIARAWRMTTDGDPAERVRELTERALRGGELAGEADSLLVPLSAAVLVLNEGLELASQLCEAGIEQARARGWPSPLAFAQWLRANIEYRRGNLGAAGSDAAGALAFTSENAAEVALPWVVAVFSDVQVAQGRLAEAEEAHARASLDVEIPEFTRALVIESRGRLRLAQNRPEEALADLREAGRAWDSIGMVSPDIARWRGDAVTALLRLDQAEEARELAERQLELARGLGGRGALGLALRTAAAAQTGEGRLSLLGEAIDALEGSEAKLEYARALAEQGQALLDSGDREAAREPLNRALALARSCGATPLAERAYELLEASGARPRKLIRGGLESLTPSELRVARMAADGLANKQIAQTLFVTVRTVETHLRHTYQKLDISSRDQLAGALRPRDTEDSLAAAG